MAVNDTYNANVQIRELSREIDRRLGMLAALRAVPKYEIIRLALEEFVENHKDEIAAIV